MGRFSGILLATDLDGTLLCDDKTVSPENAGAIRAFQREGGLFTVATGRYPDFLDRYSDVFKVNECIIALNGNLICSPSDGSTLFVSQMKSAEMKSVLDEVIKEFGDKIPIVQINDELESYTYRGEVKRDTCKTVLVCKNEVCAKSVRSYLRARHGQNCEIVRSWATGVEIYKKGSGKGECVKYIAEKINPAICKTVCVGDYENDVSMLLAADIGCAVQNAVGSAKHAADIVVPRDNNHSAIAWVIDSLDGIIQEGKGLS